MEIDLHNVLGHVVQVYMSEDLKLELLYEETDWSLKNNKINMYINVLLIIFYTEYSIHKKIVFFFFRNIILNLYLSFKIYS